MNRTEEIKMIFKESGAIITGDHFVYTSNQRHGSVYVNKDAVYPHTERVSRLCRFFAEDFFGYGVDTVVGPVVGGIGLSQWTANHMSKMIGKEVFAVCADKIEKTFSEDYINKLIQMFNAEEWGSVTNILHNMRDICTAETTFIIKRGQEKFITGKNIFIVEDVLTTGNSVKKVVEAVEKLGGNIVGVGALCNRGNVTAEFLGVPVLKALMDVSLETFPGDDCPLCKKQIPINTKVGHGAKFLKAKQDTLNS